MKTAYRFTKRKNKPFIEVTFAHIPNRWFSTKTDDITKAVQFAEAKMKEVTGKKEDITLREFANDFFTEKDPQGFRHRLERRDTHFEESYFQQHQARLENHILPQFGDYRLSSLNDTMIDDFILDIPKIANNTKNKILTCFRLVLREAVRQGYIKDNPADKVKELPNNYTYRQAFTHEELKRLFPDNDDELIKLWNGAKNKDGLKWAVYFLIQKDTGWRPNEVAGLKKINYFPELKGIYTEQGVSWRTHEMHNRIKTTHKGQKFKNGFLTDQTDRLLRQLINITHGEHLFAVSRKNGVEKFIYAELANKRLRTVCWNACVNLGDRTQYSFRHTFNTNALGNMPEQARLLLMGHTSNRQEYNHLTPRETLERVLKLLQ